MSVFDVFLFQKLFDLYDYLILLLYMTLNFLAHRRNADHQ